MKMWNEYLIKKVLNKVLAETPEIHQKTLNKNTAGSWSVFVEEIGEKDKGFLRIAFGKERCTLSLNGEEFPDILYKDIETLFGYTIEDAKGIKTFAWPED
ncbi:MAG: hypothetical protein KAV80_01110 [Methanomicrobia archaeon]|nr:hypothetical protein [Methanomicrobia archaeon]